MWNLLPVCKMLKRSVKPKEKFKSNHGICLIIITTNFLKASSAHMMHLWLHCYCYCVKTVIFVDIERCWAMWTNTAAKFLRVTEIFGMFNCSIVKSLKLWKLTLSTNIDLLARSTIAIKMVSQCKWGGGWGGAQGAIPNVWWTNNMATIHKVSIDWLVVWLFKWLSSCLSQTLGPSCTWLWFKEGCCTQILQWSAISCTTPVMDLNSIMNLQPGEIFWGHCNLGHN